MVLVILAVVWAIVLIPPAIRARAEGRPGDSITNFRQQLAVLRRTGPRARLAGEMRSRSGAGSLSPMATVSRIDAYGPRVAGRAPARTARAARGATAGLVSHSAAARQRSQRRRRDVLTTLLVLAVATLALGLVPALRVVLVVHVIVDALLVAYVALLIHQRNAAAEREMKVRFLPGTGVFTPDAVREPALLRRSAN